MKNLRKYIIAGLLVWLPLAVTWQLLKFVIGQMDRWLDNFLLWLPPEYHPDQLLGIELHGLGVIFTFLMLVITGMLAANFVGRAFVNGWESLLDRIPVVRAVYSAVKKFAEMVFFRQERILQERTADPVPARRSLQPGFPDFQ